MLKTRCGVMQSSPIYTHYPYYKNIRNIEVVNLIMILFFQVPKVDDPGKLVEKLKEFIDQQVNKTGDKKKSE